MKFLHLALSALLAQAGISKKLFARNKNAKNGKECSTENIVNQTVDVGLGSFNQKLQAEIYSCETDTNFPLIVFVCGGTSFSDTYSMAAKEFVKRGYAIALLNLRLELPFGPTPIALNFVGSNDVLKFVNFAQSPVFPEGIADTSRWILMGHSFGGSAVLYYLANLCPANNCCDSRNPFACFLQGLDPEVLSDFSNDGEPLPEPIAVATFATTAITQGGLEQLKLNTELTGATGNSPFFLVNGYCDAKNFDTDQNGTILVDGTLDIITNDANDKVFFASLTNLDHFSIQDRLGDSFDINNECNSSLPRDVQVKATVEALTYWVEKQITFNIRNVCEDMLTDSALGEMGFELVRCEPNNAVPGHGSSQGGRFGSGK